MRINRNNHRALFDVDGTIIKPLSEATSEEKTKYASIDIETPWGLEAFLVLHHVVNLIKRHHMQGHHVTVHSQGGWEWAETIVKTLKLEEYVDEIATKPQWYTDDLSADEWMKRTIP